MTRRGGHSGFSKWMLIGYWVMMPTRHGCTGTACRKPSRLLFSIVRLPNDKERPPSIPSWRNCLTAVDGGELIQMPALERIGDPLDGLGTWRQAGLSLEEAPEAPGVEPGWRRWQIRRARPVGSRQGLRWGRQDRSRRAWRSPFTARGPGPLLDPRGTLPFFPERRRS